MVFTYLLQAPDRTRMLTPETISTSLIHRSTLSISGAASVVHQRRQKQTECSVKTNKLVALQSLQ